MNVLHRKYIHKKDKKRVLQQKSLQQRACASIKVRYFFAANAFAVSHGKFFIII